MLTKENYGFHTDGLETAREPKVQLTTRYLPEQSATEPPARLGPFRLVQPSHQPPLTQEQRLIRAKQSARTAAVERNLLILRDVVQGERRFTGESITGHGALA